ncbi:helix-turn-helix domain-containing protein [Komagataeibacter xylinus]|uniref:Helix-turn-helix domain-containing protein n=1 Tax=Komagataeibacter xylinus TaxID=28448 RepID=A0A857FV17_KOMXY|nr:S24 family peptidase [Komagataeibacter xylinus]QHC36484.1 helix-turn-helix domain-containing protein [Komagataeibacter xylinus]
MDEIRSPAAAEIERRMERLNLNKKRLADLAGLNETYVHDILRGKSRNPGGDRLEKVAAVLGCTASDLLRGGNGGGAGAAASRLKALRERAGYTVRALARDVGMGERFSSYAFYENKLKKDFIPVELVRKLVPLLTDRGDPPIAASEVWALCGIVPGATDLNESISRAERASMPVHNEDGAVTVHEYDISPQAGAGAIVDHTAAGEGESHPTLDSWRIPRDFIRNYLPDTGGLAIIRVAGNSMEPEFVAGDRVLVDTGHRIPSPDGVYVLWNGMGVVIKQLMLVPNSRPPRIRIISVNPTYPVDEVDASDLVINGRVVGKWVWK